jgi:hypothetical protein
MQVECGAVALLKFHTGYMAQRYPNLACLLKRVELTRRLWVNLGWAVHWFGGRSRTNTVERR